METKFIYLKKYIYIHIIHKLIIYFQTNNLNYYELLKKNMLLNKLL